MDVETMLIAALALAAGGFAKGATGMGLPLIALPVLVPLLGLQHAVSLMTLPLIFTNAWQVWRFRGELRAPALAFMPRFLAGCVVGIVIGTAALTMLPERLLVTGTGTILLAYIALRLFRPHLTLGPAGAKRYAVPAGISGGILQGATGISAPIGVTFIHSMSLLREAHLFAVSAMFMVYAVAQLFALWGAQIMRLEWLLHGVMALVPILAFMPAGQAFSSRLSRKAFDRLILVFLAVAGLKMVSGL